MKTYKHEKDIKDLIAAQAKTCLAVEIFSLKSDETDEIKSFRLKFAKAATEHPDLMCGNAILASTVMNKNDDVFLPEETWEARNTPVNTPFNQDHEEKQIIGHITSACVLGEDGEEYTGDSAPDYFDVGVGFVVYKDIFPTKAAEIMTLGPAKRLFVSMEAIMKDFDYALVSNAGDEVKIVKRNDETSFLTKSLRIFGGSGKYGDYRVGRVLRDFRFSGMANVDDPANPKSIYTSISSDTSVAKLVINAAAKNVISTVSNLNFDNNFLYETKGNVMVIETLDQAKKVIADLEAKSEASVKDINTKLTEALAELKLKNDELSGYSGKIAASIEEKQSLEAKLAILEKSSADLKSNVDTIAKQLDDKTKANDAMQAALDAYKKASMKSDRTAAIKSLGFDVSDAEADSYASMSEDIFAGILSFAKEKMKKNDKKKDDEKDDKDKEDKSKSAKDDSKDEDKKDKEDKDKKDAGAAAAALLAKAEEEKSKDDLANAGGEANSKDQEIATTAANLAKALFNRKVKSKINKSGEKSEKADKNK